ncbi:hypothetical protein FOZ60_001971 [Perkinsus olseni]|uniref:Uncharacterized protein n=1 Tax=Perkinsus olseni TaxID=32597 RepID=A0A7J6P054_PEROL|nr:hypothetical protein FOZ60_001971 [Perkinsus olseni]
MIFPLTRFPFLVVMFRRPPVRLNWTYFENPRRSTLSTQRRKESYVSREILSVREHDWADKHRYDILRIIES